MAVSRGGAHDALGHDEGRLRMRLGQRIGEHREGPFRRITRVRSSGAS